MYLFNGDSHRFHQDRPLAAGSPWLGFYGVRGSAANLRRVTVDGSDLGEADWLKVTVQPRGRDLLALPAGAGSLTSPRTPAGGSEQHADGVDQHADQAADDGAVDPDELQVAADVQLDPAGGLLAVPAVRRCG